MSMPENEIKRLRTIRAKDLKQFRAEIAVARRFYTLREIAQALSTAERPCPHTTVRKWETSADPALVAQLLKERKIEDVTLRQRRRDLRQRQPQERRARMDVPVTERARLRELAGIARRHRRWSDPNGPEARATEELNALVREYDARGVTTARIAYHMGVTWRAVAARLERTSEVHAA